MTGETNAVDEITKQNNESMIMRNKDNYGNSENESHDKGSPTT